jgi:hypothetical protein
MPNQPDESRFVLEEPEPEKEQVALLGFNPARVSLAGAKAAIAAWEAGEFSIKWLEAMAVHPHAAFAAIAPRSEVAPVQRDLRQPGVQAALA